MISASYLGNAVFCTAFYLIDIFINVKVNFYLIDVGRTVLLLSLTAIKKRRCAFFFILLSHFHLFIVFLSSKSENNNEFLAFIFFCFHEQELLERLCIQSKVLYVWFTCGSYRNQTK